MEQKQLDELDESFFGEEFVDDEEIGQKPVKSHETMRAEEKKERKEPLPSKKVKVTKRSTSKMGEKEHEDMDELEDAEEEKEVKITPAKVPTKSASKVETASPIDPWGEDKESGSGVFKETSTWQAIAGIAVILLIVSVFTQGFRFTEQPQVAGALSLSQAEEKAVQYVNTNLLQPPFTATIKESKDSGNLYKVTLDVGGQQVNSYITKDGKLFFPQGFDTALGIDAQLGSPTAEEKPAEVPPVAEPSNPTLGEAEPQPVEEQPDSGVDVLLIPVQAKKWVFAPSKITATQGDIIRLSLIPIGLEFTFAIPELGVEKEVSGPTEVEFVASKAGTFEFTCASCEEWRGKKGKLVLKKKNF